MTNNVLHKPLPVTVLVQTSNQPLGEVATITLSPGIEVDLVDRRPTQVFGLEGPQYVGYIFVASFDTREAKRMSFFVSQTAYNEATDPIPPVVDN